MRESTLVSQIQRFCRDLARQNVPVKCIKIHGNQYTEAGTPDLHVTINGHSIWVECKVGRNQPTPIQVRRIEEWRAAGATVAVVRTLEEFRQILQGHIDEPAE